MISALCEAAQVHFEARGAEISGFFVGSTTLTLRWLASDERAVRASAARRATALRAGESFDARSATGRAQEKKRRDRSVGCGRRYEGVRAARERAESPARHALELRLATRFAMSAGRFLPCWRALRCALAWPKVPAPENFGDLPEMSNRSLWN